MAATYPLAVRTFTQKRNLFDDVEASHINDIQDEIEALETALGDMPHVDNTNKVTYPSVAARLDAMAKHTDPPVWDFYNPETLQYKAQGGVKTNFVPLKVATGDTDNLFDGTGVKIKRDGWYHMNAGGYFLPNSTYGVRHLQIHRITGQGDGGVVADSTYEHTADGLTYSNGGLDVTFTGLFHAGDRAYISVCLDSWGNSYAPFSVFAMHLHGFMVRGL